MDNKSEMFIGYFPVIHDGYIKAIDRHPKSIIGILNDETVNSLGIDYIRKDIRALSPEIAKLAIEGLGRQTKIIGKTALDIAMKSNVVMPYDEISRQIIANYPEANITTEPVFLRWDRDNSSEQSMIEVDEIIDINKDSELVKIIGIEVKKSSNWFRHVGSAIFDNDGILMASHNSPLPTEYSSWIDGDPRITAKKGELIDRSIDIHAEASLIARAAKHGISLEGKSICVSTFPCPNCAKLIALSGINKCYFIDGYAMLDGQSILKNYGVKIIKINTDLKVDKPNSLKPYPSK